MYLDFQVKIPTESAGITRKKIKGTTYIYYAYEHDYNTEKGYTVPKNTTIGKCTDDDSELMYPNTNFLKFFRLRNCRKQKAVLTGVGALGLVPILYCVRLLRSIAWMKCWEISLERTAVCF